MKSIIYKNDCYVELDGIKIPFYDKQVNNELKHITRDKLSLCEWKAFIFGRYNTNFEYRNEIIIKGYSDGKLNVGDKICIKDGSIRKLGVGTIDSVDIEKNKYIVKLKNLKVYVDGKESDDIKKLFNNKLNDKELNKYLNGMFKMTYYSIMYYFKYYYCDTEKDYETPENKFSAFCSYLAIKDVLKDYNISQLDSFVEENKCEYDALILKSNVDNNKRLYKRDEVLATIEIKTSGYFCSTKKHSIKEQFKNYMKEEAIDGIPHIYIALHETESYYKETYDAIKELNNKIIPIFCKIQKNVDSIIIPKEWDLEELLDCIK